MNRRILNFYYIISVIFLLFILIFTAYRLKITIDANREESTENLESLRISALSVYLAEGDFIAEYFKTTMRQEFLTTDRLVLLAIYSSREGILYLLSKDQRYLVEAPTAAGSTRWNGAPEYTLRPLYESPITLLFSPGIRNDLYIDGIFQDLEGTQVYPILREIFYIVLVYLLIATVFLLAAATSRDPETFTASKPRWSRPTPPARTRDLEKTSATTAGGLFSPETGLGWNDHLAQRLGSELERAAASDQDLSLLLISSSELDRHNLKVLGKYILEVFPFRDLAFEYDSRAAAVILPDKDLDQSLQEARGFQSRLRSDSWSRPVNISIGMSARNGRLISPNRLLTEVSQALQQAESAGGGQIIAFRADPDKYRSAIATARSAGRQRR
jgi:GGDEF domain-containing protein